MDIFVHTSIHISGKRGWTHFKNDRKSKKLSYSRIAYPDIYHCDARRVYSFVSSFLLLHISFIFFFFSSNKRYFYYPIFALFISKFELILCSLTLIKLLSSTTCPLSVPSLAFAITFAYRWVVTRLPPTYPTYPTYPTHPSEQKWNVCIFFQVHDGGEQKKINQFTDGWTFVGGWMVFRSFFYLYSRHVHQKHNLLNNRVFLKWGNDLKFIGGRMGDCFCIFFLFLFFFTKGDRPLETVAEEILKVSIIDG